MLPQRLLIVGVLMLTFVLAPAAASAQRGSGRHHGGRAVDRPGSITGQPVAVPATVLIPVVVPPVVVQPIFGHSSFGSIPVRTGFGTVPVRTGFGMVPVRTGFGTTPARTGFGVQAHPTSITAGGRHVARARGCCAFKSRHATGAVVVVGYPVLYPYAYLAEYGDPASPAGYQSERSNITVFGGVEVSGDPATYSMGVAVEAGSTSGLNFEVSPDLAEVYVDGSYMGTVRDFSPERAPFTITPGNHWIELRAPGYRTITLDAAIPADQIIKYQGTLERVRPH